jgi:hypothetical protein
MYLQTVQPSADKIHAASGEPATGGNTAQHGGHLAPGIGNRVNNL